MSTPIESNTEELQEILQTVYNLPNAGGGSSEPDLVIGMNLGSEADNKPLPDRTAEDFSILSGTLQNVIEKIKNGDKPRVLLRECQYYNTLSWSLGVTEAHSVHLVNIDWDDNLNYYPDEVFARVMID